MMNSMNNVIKATQELALASVREFVEFLHSKDVEVPEEMIQEFLESQGVKMTKTGRISKVNTRAKAPSKKGTSKRTALFDYLKEEVDGRRRRDAFKALLSDDDARDAEFDSLHEHFEGDNKRLETIDQLRQWFADRELSNSGPPSQIVNKFGGLKWAQLGAEGQEAYKLAATEANNSQPPVAEPAEPVVVDDAVVKPAAEPVAEPAAEPDRSDSDSSSAPAASVKASTGKKASPEALRRRQKVAERRRKREEQRAAQLAAGEE